MNGKAEVKARYDRTAESLEYNLRSADDIFKNVSPVMRYFRKRKIDKALNLGGFEKGSRILEIGSNVGQYTTLLAERGFKMVGVDLSDKTIEIAKRYAQECHFEEIEYFFADAEDLSLFKDNTFDGVVSFSTLRYVPDLPKAVKEIYRVTKKGGAVVLDFPNKYCPWFSILKNKLGVENHVHDHFYSAKEISSLFEEIGFCDIESKKIMFTHYTFKPAFLLAYKVIDSVGERIPFVREAAAIIMCKGIKG